MANIKIGLVLTRLPGYSETFFYSKINGLLAAGYEVKLFVNTKDPRAKNEWQVYEQPNVSGNLFTKSINSIIAILKTFITSPVSSLKFIKYERAIGRSWERALYNYIINSKMIANPVDILHFGFGVIAINRESVTNAINAKMYISLRGYDISVYPLQNKDCYKLLWQKVDKVHSISNALLDKALALGLPSDVLSKVIPPAIDIDKYTWQPNKRKDKTIRLITVGRLIWKKGYEYALEAMHQLKVEGIDFHYTIVGEGEDWERLHFARHQWGLENEVTFLGKVEHDLIPDLLSHHDIYIQPSIQEGFCNAVLEAQASGLLCVVTDAEGLPENVLHNKTGWVVPRYDAVAIAEQVQQILQMEEKKKDAIRSQARERVEKDFNINDQIQAFISFYES